MTIMRLLLVNAPLCALFATACLAAQNAIILPHAEAGLSYWWILDGCGISSQPDEVCDVALLSSALPPGLVLDSVSRLTGTPTAKGTYRFTVRFQKYPRQVSDRTYALEVKDPDGPPAAISVNRSALYFGVSADGSFRTSPQSVSVTTPGDVPGGWSAISNNARFTFNGRPMDQDTRTRDFKLDAAVSAGPEGRRGTITVASSQALPGSFHTIEVVQSVVDASAPPTGSFDTPSDNAVVWGTVPFAGWALDNIEVSKVDIWREPVTRDEVLKGSLVYIGDARFVPDARPDVEADHPKTPLNYRAAWGYTLLTSGLPTPDGTPGSPTNAYKFHAVAHGKSGLTMDLGTRSIMVDNNHGARPFGHIDTPNPDATVSGEYTSFAWALTQPPYSIPSNGSTIWVGIDGQLVAHPVYNGYRPDVAAAFPNFINSPGAVGSYTFDTTKLANGTHTISWLVTDNGGRSQEIGSNAFQVRNTESGSSGKSEQPAPISGGAWLRRGFDPNRSPETLSPSQQGDYFIQMEQLGRIELQLGAADGHQLVNGQRRPLPIGSSLNEGTFYWQAGLGFLGQFHLVFLRTDSTEVRADVKIVPKTYSPAN
jgi:hypothetical protein